jgi:hypothetical protein
MSLPTLDMPARGKSAAIVTLPTAQGFGEFFFSYRTIIAFRGNHAGTGEYVKVRMENHWSRTTGRHFSDLGCKGFDVVKPEEFAKAIGFQGKPEELTGRA